IADLNGSAPRQLSYGESSLQDPDIGAAGNIAASRLRIQFDIWKYPVEGTASENVSQGAQITRQTGQGQTPSVSPDDREMAYLSDENSHGNVWILDLATGATRQITTESDPRVTVGLPVWSPNGTYLALVSTRDTPDWGTLGLWLVRPDGSDLKKVVDGISGFPTWSSDGRWLFYTKPSGDIYRIEKIEVPGA